MGAIEYHLKPINRLVMRLNEFNGFDELNDFYDDFDHLNYH